MKTGHYLLLSLLAVVILFVVFAKGCINCTGRALSGPEPTNTVVVPVENR